MAISNDERRQAAARLRSVADKGAPEWATSACCIAECLGEDNYPLWNGSEKLFDRLADLIEPEPERTCEFTYELGDDGWWWYCSNCCVLPSEYDLDNVPNYCPNCGSKVVD